MNRQLNILLVEDSPSDAELIGIFLEQSPLNVHPHQADSVTSSLDAIDQAAACGEPFNCVLLDLGLPDCRGIETYRRLAGHAPDLPVIILSGNTEDGLALQAVQEGAQDYLPKSEMSSSSLARAVRYAVERHERALGQKRLENLERDMQTAATIQKRLLPLVPADVPGIDIAARSIPAEATGGDFYDFFRLSNGRVGTMIADVSGHGLGAAFIMASTMGTIRSLVHNEADPGEILTAANQHVLAETGAEHFVTAFYGVIDPHRRELVFANAGHGGWLLHDCGTIESLDSPGGFPLGIVDDHSYQTSSLIRLKPNTSLIMLTDGIHEAIDSSETMFSMERVQAALRDLRGASAEELVEGTLAIVSKFCHPRLPLDDMTMVALRLREPT